MRPFLRATLAVIPAAVLLTTAPLASAGTATPPAGQTLHASTAVTGRPDSGTAGDNWALDAFTRTATLRYAGAAPASDCGGTSPCYHFTGNVKDSGHFTTIAGNTVPGTGDLNGGAPPAEGVAATGAMAGEYHYSFYSGHAYVLARRVPAAEDDAGALPTGRHTTGMWLAQFFSAGATFWDSTGTATTTEIGNGNGSWSYLLPPGADSQCPNATSQWVDGSATSWGSLPADGNILAPDASHC